MSEELEMKQYGTGTDTAPSTPSTDDFASSKQPNITTEPKPPPPDGDSSEYPEGGSEYPEGGTHAWLTIAGASICMFVSFGWVNCAGIFQAHYQNTQLNAYSPSEIAWIPALQSFFMFAAGLMVGKVFDDYGPGILLGVGTVLHVGGIMLTSVSTKYYQILLAQAVCSGIGASMVFFPAFTCATTWFQRKRGAALGLVVMGSSIGGVILPIMLINLIPKVGFPWALRICGFLIFLLLIWANLTVRSRIPPAKRPFEITAFIRPLGEVPFTLLTAAIFFFYWGMFIPFTFIVVEAKAQGVSEHLAKYLVPILNAASIIGRTVPNALADKLGHYNIMIAMSAFTTIIMATLWIPASGDAATIAFAVLFGIASGAGIGVVPVLVAQISPLKQIGTRTGTTFFIASLAALTGSPIGGAILSAGNGDYTYTKLFGVVNCAIGVFLFIASRFALGGWKGKQ